MMLKTAFFSVLSAVVLGITPAASQPTQLTVLHTNDLHASFLPHEAAWVKQTPRPMIGGFVELEFKVDSIRKQRSNTLLLDAGDVMTGNPITDIEYEHAAGGALFAMMNMIGYDAWCPGNHDFDISQENLKQIVRIVRFPTLCANLVDSAGTFPVGNIPYRIIEKGGLRVGIIGIISQELYDLVNQNNLVGLRVLSPTETLQKYADELTPKTDLLIALTHQGADEDSVLAANVRGVQLIVGGHSHTRMKHPRRVNGTLIVQTGSNCENLGVLDLSVENHRITRYDGNLVSLWPGTDRPTTELSRLAAKMKSKIDEEYNEVIGTLSADWTRRNGESAIGTFIAEAQRAAAHADFAFMNTHGIRKDVSAGPMTKKDLFEVLPFRNVLLTFQLSGKELRNVMTFYFEKQPAIQFAGIDCQWRRLPDGKAEIVSMEVNGKPLDEERMYIGAASDYFVGEADKYIGVAITHPIILQQTVFGAVEKAVRREKTITPKLGYHLKEIK